MIFRVLSLFPEFIQTGVQVGLLGQAVKKNLLQVETHQLRDFTDDPHRRVDDRPFGGGDGMVMLPEVLAAALEKIKASSPSTRVIYLSPQGRPLDDRKVRELSSLPDVTLICGRYGGVDQRVLNQLVEEEISIGDYVLSGGELPALVVIEAVSRRLPGVLGHQDSAEQDSFAQGRLEQPTFTRPRVWRGEEVPEVLMSGHHAHIQAWNRQLAALVTLKKRPELMNDLTPSQWGELEAFWGRLSPSERQACGLEGLEKSSFQGRKSHS